MSDADFLLEASLSFAPADGDKPRRFSMSAYDGGLLSLANAPHPVVVDLAGVRQVDQVKALLHHDPHRPVGHMEKVEISREIRAEGILSHPDNAREILAAQRNGFAWEASIGATILNNAREVIPAGQTVSVNGRTFSGPLIVARKTLLREVSFTGQGAGRNTSAFIVASAILQHEDPSMTQPTDPSKPANPPANPAPVVPPAATVTAPTAPAGVTLTAQQFSDFQTLQASMTASIATANAEAKALKEERERIQRERLVQHVDTIVAQYGAPGDEILASLRDKARSGDVSEADIELAIVRAHGAQKLKGFTPLGGQTGAPASQQVIEAALLLTGGWDERELADRKLFDDKTINAALENRWRGFGLRALTIEQLRNHGHHVLGGQLQDEDIQASLTFCEQDQIQASGGMSTLSLPGILSNVARKELLRSFDAFQKAIVTIAKRATASDYKPFYMYRVSTGAVLEQVGPDGELKAMELKEDEFQSRVYPFGRKMAVNAVMIKNDDLGAFQDVARLFGLTAARTIEYAGFKCLLSDQSNFWTTGKGNRLASGGTSALSLDSLGSAYNLFLGMTDFTGQPIGIQPKYLLTGPADAVKARQYQTSTTVNLASAGDTDVVYERTADNPWKGMFQPLYSPYLKSGMVANATNTQWLLTADPTITAPIVVAYLDGRATPQIKTWEAIPGKMGMQWDATLGFGFNLHDDTGSVFSPGA